MSFAANPSAALAILHWKGRHHLEALLPTAQAAVERLGQPCPVIVVDNAASLPDNDGAWVRETFPWVEYVAAPANDYLFSYNWLIQQRREEVVILLNNDLRLDPRFISPLLKHFAQPEVFAVSAQSLDWEGNASATGAWLPRLHHGWLFFEPAFPKEAVTTFFASGGFSAFRRSMVLELGGFDRLFYPAYFEETDLCYRAWQRGWEVRYEPGSLTHHRESPSLSQMGRVSSMMRRNQFLFQWKHLAHEPFSREFAVYCLWMALLGLARGRTGWITDLRAARKAWRSQKTEVRNGAVTSLGFEAIASRIGLPVARV